MVALISFLLFLLWLAIAFALTKVLFKFTKSQKKSPKFWVVCLLISGLPFLENVFVFSSFRAHCAIYGGGKTLHPISADRLGLEKGSWGVARLLAHPQISSVYLHKNVDEKLGPKSFWISISRKNQDCKEPINARLISSSQGSAKRFIYKLMNQGYCFHTRDMGQLPQYTLMGPRSKKVEKFSWLLPYSSTVISHQIQEGFPDASRVVASYQMINVSDRYLLDALLPSPIQLNCAAAKDRLGDHDFPFGNPFYQFLNDIVS